MSALYGLDEGVSSQHPKLLPRYHPWMFHARPVSPPLAWVAALVVARHAGLVVALSLTIAGCEATEDAAPPAPDVPVADPDVLVPPAPPQMTISPAKPGVRDDLVATGATDLRWTRDGAPVDASATVPFQLTARGELWRVEGTVSNAAGESPPGAAEVLIGNTAPECSLPTIQVDDLTGQYQCSCTATDADGDPIAKEQCTWEAAGMVLGTTECLLAPGDTPSKGTLLRCTMVLSDPVDAGQPATVALTIPDAVPLGGVVTLGPDSATETDTLTCMAAGAFDPDGDPISWSFSWRVGDSEVVGASDPTLTGADCDKGDVVRCAARPGQGLEVLSNPVVIQNSPPVLGAAWAQPPAAGRLEGFECETDGVTDPDPADNPTVGVEWLLLPADLLVGTGPTLSAQSLIPGNRLRCRARADDLESTSPWVTSSLVTVINYPPALSNVTVVPAEPIVTDTLTCAADVEDADGDTVTVSWEWRRNGQILSGATGPELSGLFARGDTIVCVATPLDAFDPGAPVLSPEVVIANAPPVVAVQITGGVWCEAFQCSAQISDPDGDDTTATVSWSGAGTADGDTATVTQASLPLECEVTADDGSLETSASASVVPQLAQTTVQGAAITPGSPVLGDTLTCTAVGASDPCSTPVSTVTWWVGGVAVSSPDSLATSDLNPGDTVHCSVEVSGGGSSLPAWATSTPVVLQTPPPEAPLVSISAPLGADGSVQCLAVSPGTSGLDFAVFWQIGDGPEQAGQSALSADQVSHCDRIRCRMIAQVDGQPLASNVAELIVPLGSDCTEDNPCIAGLCGPAGGCTQAPKVGSCDDGLACTGSDGCSDGECVGQPVSCDDGNACTDNSCAEPTGCVVVALDGPCSDDNACTVGDVCAGGSCAPGPTASCDDSNPCTSDSCDPVAGCVAQAAAGSCDDDNPCTDGDTCSDGGCAGSPVGAAVACGTGPAFCLAGSCVDNQPPTIPSVSILPANPVSGDVIECAAGDSVDPDLWPGDPVTYEIIWSVNGVTVASGPPPVMKGQVVGCSVLAFDGASWSGPATAQKLVGNAPPSVSEVAVEGNSPDAPLQCIWTAADPDDPAQQLAPTITWTVNGVAAGFGAKLDAAEFSGCDSITCSAQVSDGQQSDQASAAAIVLLPGQDCGASACVAYSCAPTGGCQSTVLTGACDDGDVCTQDTSCVGQVCSGQVVVCDDDDGCTIDSCDPVSGCVAAPTDACDDAIACTLDSCDAVQGCLIDGLPTPGSDFDLTLGFSPAANDWVVAVDQDPLEVVQGAQGSLHVEPSFRLVAPAGLAGSPLFIHLQAQLRTPCCDGVVGGQTTLPTALTYAVAQGVYERNLLLPLNDPSLASWVGKTACIEVTAGLYEDNSLSKPVAWAGTVRQVFTLTD